MAASQSFALYNFGGDDVVQDAYIQYSGLSYKGLPKKTRYRERRTRVMKPAHILELFENEWQKSQKMDPARIDEISANTGIERSKVYKWFYDRKKKQRN